MVYFGPFGFHVRTGRLTRDGADLPLGRTAARVLAVLLEHRPRAATQEEEILRTVWPSHVVDRGAVKGYISDLRAILGDDPRLATSDPLSTRVPTDSAVAALESVFCYRAATTLPRTRPHEAKVCQSGSSVFCGDRSSWCCRVSPWSEFATTQSGAWPLR
jgi:hypothetical protein